MSPWERNRPHAVAGAWPAVLLAGTAFAGPIEDGYPAYTRGDYPAAFKIFVPLAEQGNPEAEYSVGVIYSNGRGLPQSYMEAAKWFHRAAEKGQSGAQYDLGVLYAKGQGVPQNFAEAAKWFRQAAEQGKAAAQYNLGFMYTQGQGVGQDFAEAAKWYRKAAEQGDMDSQNRLAALYLTATACSRISPKRRSGIARRPIKATSRRRTSWDRSTATARAYRRTMSRRIGGSSIAASRDAGADFETHDNAVGIAKLWPSKMTPEQIAAAQKLAKAWKPN